MTEQWRSETCGTCMNHLGEDEPECCQDNGDEPAGSCWTLKIARATDADRLGEIREWIQQKTHTIDGGDVQFLMDTIDAQQHDLVESRAEIDELKAEIGSVRSFLSQSRAAADVRASTMDADLAARCAQVDGLKAELGRALELRGTGGLGDLCERLRLRLRKVWLERDEAIECAYELEAKLSAHDSSSSEETGGPGADVHPSVGRNANAARAAGQAPPPKVSADAEPTGADAAGDWVIGEVVHRLENLENVCFNRAKPKRWQSETCGTCTERWSARIRCRCTRDRRACDKWKWKEGMMK